MIRVVHIEPQGRVAVVTIGSESRQEAAGRAARELAVAEATRVIGPCGFSAFEMMAYKDADGTLHQSDQELAAVVPHPGGEYLQQVRVQARI